MYKLTAAVLALTLALPALAEHNEEHRVQEAQALKDSYLVPNYGNDYGQLVVYDPLTEAYQLLGLYGLAALCQNYGGYHYDGGDGYSYWHDCTGATH
jgi:hypothetical protein